MPQAREQNKARYELEWIAGNVADLYGDLVRLAGEDMLLPEQQRQVRHAIRHLGMVLRRVSRMSEQREILTWVEKLDD